MSTDQDTATEPTGYELPPYAVDEAVTLSRGAGVTVRVQRIAPWTAPGVTWLSLGQRHDSLAVPLTDGDRRRLIAMLGGTAD